MSASVTLLNLSLVGADGGSLFTDLNLRFGPERTGIVGRNGVGKSTLLRVIAGQRQPSSGRVVVSGLVGLLDQSGIGHDAGIVADLFGADLFGVDPALADWSQLSCIEASLRRCGLDGDDLHRPLASLSGGQRVRAALAALIHGDPDFLLLDEPTNNLDRAGRRAVVDLLQGWRGGAIVVSHDRALLEEMDAIVDLTSLGATRYGGNYSHYRLRKDAELAGARRDLAAAERQLAEVAAMAQQAAERKARKDGAGMRARARGGQPKILMDAKRDRAEASGGANARLREARGYQAEQTLADSRARVKAVLPLAMAIPPTGLPSTRTVLRLDQITAGYQPDPPLFRDLSLTITGPERIVVNGPNGSGKSTLIRLITGQLSPLAGTVSLSVLTAVLDQRAGLLEPEQTLVENFQRLSPQASRNAAHAALARSGFRAADGLRLSGDLSGGERLRVGLACVLGQIPPPALLILDEPTNHLDLDGIAALESALDGYDGALLVISHDEPFLARLGIQRSLVLLLPG